MDHKEILEARHHLVAQQVTLLVPAVVVAVDMHLIVQLQHSPEAVAVAAQAAADHQVQTILVIQENTTGE